jgi:KRAB domain-containing zinc finger protein
LAFRQRGEFNIHMRIHSGARPFKCFKCDYQSRTSSNLRQHLLIVHQTKEVYQCRDCEKKFEFLKDFNAHKRDLHQNKWIYKKFGFDFWRRK